MRTRTRSWIGAVGAATVMVGALLISTPARAHCDTLDGPVVKSARQALSKGDVTPVLKWVKKGAEPEIRAAFKKTLAVRAAGKEAMALADTYFFETLVRVHRAGEGAPYTGLKSSPAEPVIAKTDAALDQGSIDRLAKSVASAVETGIRQRFARAAAAKQKAASSVEAGREFVEAYVQLTHYVEAVHNLVGAHGGQHAKPPSEQHAHHE